jgi:hypothetical protein
MTVWRVRIACWIHKATKTHSEYIIITAFPKQQWLPVSALVLRHSILPVLFNYSFPYLSVPLLCVSASYHYLRFLPSSFISFHALFPSFELAFRRAQYRRYKANICWHCKVLTGHFTIPPNLSIRSLTINSCRRGTGHRAMIVGLLLKSVSNYAN